MTGLMLAWVPLQAVNPLDPRSALGRTGGMLFRDVLLILGLAAVLVVGLLVWARHYVRHRKRHRDHSRPGILETVEEGEDRGPHRHRRRRRRRRDHRARNPTLSETGGLPPVRPEPPPSQPA